MAQNGPLIRIVVPGDEMMNVARKRAEYNRAGAGAEEVEVDVEGKGEMRALMVVFLFFSFSLSDLSSLSFFYPFR